MHLTQSGIGCASLTALHVHTGWDGQAVRQTNRKRQSCKTDHCEINSCCTLSMWSVWCKGDPPGCLQESRWDHVWLNLTPTTTKNVLNGAWFPRKKKKKKKRTLAERSKQCALQNQMNRVQMIYYGFTNPELKSGCMHWIWLILINKHAHGVSEVSQFIIC